MAPVPCHRHASFRSSTTARVPASALRSQRLHVRPRRYRRVQAEYENGKLRGCRSGKISRTIPGKEGAPPLVFVQTDDTALKATARSGVSPLPCRPALPSQHNTPCIGTACPPVVVDALSLCSLLPTVLPTQATLTPSKAARAAAARSAHASVRPHGFTPEHHAGGERGDKHRAAVERLQYWDLWAQPIARLVACRLCVRLSLARTPSRPP